jgi:hypothetical protein
VTGLVAVEPGDMDDGKVRETAAVRATRVSLASLTGLTAVSAVAGAVGLTTGTSNPGAMVARLPFHSVVFAGVALAVVVAGPMATASWLAARTRRGYPMAGMVAGLLLIGWLVVEIVVIREFSWLQVVFVAVGVAVLWLAVPTVSRGKTGGTIESMKEMS